MEQEPKLTNKIIYLKVSKLWGGLRLDKILREKFPNATFANVQKLCRKGQIRVDGKRVKSNARLEVGQEIKIPPMLTSNEFVSTENKKFVYNLSTQDKKDLKNMVIFEDDNLMVLNKPYGLPVQAGSGHSKSLDRMLESNAKEGEEPKLVHRIDKTTTGCVVIAKNKEMARELSNKFKNRKVKKIYWAIVKGKVRDLEGIIKTPIETVCKDGKEKMATKGGYEKFAETEYKVIDSAGMYHWLEVYPKTGRKHQIRVHLSSIGLPIVGDIKYGGEHLKGDNNIPHNKLFLHAKDVNLNIKKYKEFTAEIPSHFKQVFKIMEWNIKK